MESTAVAALRDALAAIGIEARPTADRIDGRLAVRAPDGSLIEIDTRASAVPTTAWVGNLRTDPHRRVVVVADQIPAGVRDDLDDRGLGWLDRRGHLRLVGDGFFIDADVPTNLRVSSTSETRPGIRGRSGLAAASALLMRPDDATAVTDVARGAGMNASSISRAMTSLADAQLAERTRRGRYRPLTPELFWELADVWSGSRTPLPAAVSDLSDPRLSAHLHDLAEVGWAVGGEAGAVRWGAPLVLTGDYPMLFYVPDDDVVRRATVLGTETEPMSPKGARSSIQVTADPIGLVTRDRHAVSGADVPLAHPVFCALDLAATSRGREALDQWDPPEGFVRVW